MKKLSKDEIQLTQGNVSTRGKRTLDCSNSTTRIKLTWAEIHKIELMKSENLFDKIPTHVHRMEAEETNESNLTASNPADFIDPVIIKRALYNSKIEAVNQNPDNTFGEEDRKIDMEFHESFCS